MINLVGTEFIKVYGHWTPAGDDVSPKEAEYCMYSFVVFKYSLYDVSGSIISKNGVVIDFLFSNATVDSPLTSDQQKLLDSFLFLK